MKKLIIFSLLLLITATAFSQKVSNVHFEQVGKKIHIYYDLEGEDNFSVQIFYQQNKSKIWEGPLKEISGAIGDTQIAGQNKQVIWDVLKENEKLMGNLSFKVEATSSICGHLIIDYAGQTYNTVKIGKQCWMKENLNVGKRIDGSQDMKDNSTIEKYCYDNKETNCSKYGGLYQWNEMMQYTTQEGVQGICPGGWHIPTDNEWVVLTDFLGGESVAGGKMKETGTVHWNSSNTGATNSSGFTALPGGSRFSNGSFSSLGIYGYWWSSTEFSSSGAWFRRLHYDDVQVGRGSSYKTRGFSVRCLKN